PAVRIRPGPLDETGRSRARAAGYASGIRRLTSCGRQAAEGLRGQTASTTRLSATSCAPTLVEPSAAAFPLQSRLLLESPRVCWRLHVSRHRGHGTGKEVLPRGAGAGGSAGVRARA